MPVPRSSRARGVLAASAALGALLVAAPAAAEDEVVPSGTGQGDLKARFSLLPHLGLAYRTDPPTGVDTLERTGALVGATFLVAPVKWLGFGVGFEHFDLGKDRYDLPPATFVDATRDLNTAWAVARLYAIREPEVSVYLGLAGGASWQSLDAEGFAPSNVLVGAPAAYKCSASATAAFGGRAGLGVEIPLDYGFGLMADAGVDHYRLDDELLDGCVAGAGPTTLLAFRAGFSYGLDVVEKKVVAPPPPPPDRDGDGIVDSVDACPESPGPASDDPAKNGCPLPKDADADGVLDDVDACPSIAGPANDDPKKNGCPPPKDADGDGVPDPEDACVDLAGVKTADAATNGCPPDTDGDGIRDDKDACKDEKGIPNEDPTKNGCPLVQVTAGEIVINEQVQFDTGKATIKPVSDALLDTVAQTMIAHPEILKIEVQGHTDDQGPKGLNKTLSQQRADAVRKALVTRKVDAKRLVAKGYGQEQPLVENTNDANRAKNRRVQFKIVEKKK